MFPPRTGTEPDDYTTQFPSNQSKKLDGDTKVLSSALLSRMPVTRYTDLPIGRAQLYRGCHSPLLLHLDVAPTLEDELGVIESGHFAEGGLWMGTSDRRGEGGRLSV